MAEPKTIGRYQILSELGHGAMGAVYRAHDPMMDRTVAIKTILAAALTGPMAQEYRDRFTREAKAAGRLTHPGIVTVYDVGDMDGTPYLVMEFVEGRTLASAMDGGERFTFDRIYDLGQQIADALGYAHRNGVIHRDIKPANILLASGGHSEPERAKLADLGVAKLTATQITTTGQLLGTPAFMPPEQFTGAIVDGRADLFSLGVILYWLSTGDKPFAGDTITAVSYKIVHSEPSQPRRINPAVPAALERIILKCLEKDPAARYLTGDALAADLASAHAGREIMQTTGPAVQQTSPGAALAPVSIMDGDPNTTLDSDARLQMSKESTSVATHQVTPVAKTVPLSAKGKKSSLMMGGIAVVVLAAVLTTWGVVSHKRRVRAEAEAAVAQAQAQLLAQQQEEERQKALVAAQQAQATLSNSAIGTPDPNAPSNGQPGQPISGNPGTTTPTPAANPNGGRGAGTGTGPEKKPSTKTPPKVTPPKTSGSAQQSSQANPNSSGTPTVTPPSQQPPPNSGSSSTPPNQTSSKPPAPANQTTATPPPTTNSGAPPAESSKLHIDDGRVPMNASFVVIMDGKPLFQRQPLVEGKPDPTKDDLFVPPGTHEFQVKTASGGIQVGESKTVKADFPPKKKMTLRVELRDNASGQTLKKSSKLDAGAAEFMISVKAAGLLGF